MEDDEVSLKAKVIIIFMDIGPIFLGLASSPYETSTVSLVRPVCLSLYML